MSKNRTSGLANRTKKRPAFGMSGFETGSITSGNSDYLKMPKSGRADFRHLLYKLDYIIN